MFDNYHEIRQEGQILQELQAWCLAETQQDEGQSLSLLYCTGYNRDEQASLPIPAEDQHQHYGGKCMRIIIVCLLALLFAGCSGQQLTQPDNKEKTEVCRPVSEQEIAALFDRWNRSLQTLDPKKVVANYAEKSLLLPTVSNKPRLTPAEKEDYFEHFLEKRPVGSIDMRYIEIGCNTALDAGLYTFTFGTNGAVVHGRYSYTYHWDGRDWFITSHHSSMMPEK